MNDTLSAIWDIIVVFTYACIRAAAVCYGCIGIVTYRVEFITTGIFIYLVSNSWEKMMNERLEKVKDGNDD